MIKLTAESKAFSNSTARSKCKEKDGQSVTNKKENMLQKLSKLVCIQMTMSKPGAFEQLQTENEIISASVDFAYYLNELT